MLKITSDISFSDPVFYSIALCLFAIAFFVNRRINTEFKSKQPKSFIDNVYVYLVVISILAIFIGAATMFTSRIYSMVSYPKYESVVIDVISRMEDKNYKDQYGKTYTESVMMHTAIVEFHDSNNNLVRKKNTASSSRAPSLGDIITVAYKDEAIAEYSFRIVLILFALGIVTTLLGIVSAGIVLFALNKSIDPVKIFGANFMVYFVIPVVMLYFAIGMVYLLWDNSVNDGDMTIPEQLAALFFALIMPPCLIMYCKFTFDGRKGEGGAIGFLSGKDDEWDVDDDWEESEEEK